MSTEYLQGKIAPSHRVSIDELKGAEILCLMAGADIDAGKPISSTDRQAMRAAVLIVRQNPRGTFSGIMARRCIPLIDTWEGCSAQL